MSTKIETGGPAFPTIRYEEAERNNTGVSAYASCTDTKGLTIRDYFAAKAMQAMLADCEQILRIIERVGDNWKDGLVSTAYSVADAMLKARNGGVA